MRGALDRFEVEGIGHNLPFLSAVMDHPRFASGNITTAFIEEEYPDGFSGAPTSDDDGKKLAACAAVMNMIAQLRRTRISGAMTNHKRRVGKAWTVFLSGQAFELTMKPKNEGAKIKFSDGTKMKVLTDWRPGTQLLTATVDGAAIAVKVKANASGYEMRYRGATHQAQIMSPRVAKLNGHMLEKVPADTSRLLLCPMPGADRVHQCLRR